MRLNVFKQLSSAGGPAGGFTGESLKLILIALATGACVVSSGSGVSEELSGDV